MKKCRSIYLYDRLLSFTYRVLDSIDQEEGA